MAVDRVQRRMAAILAADVVGYSRLMGKDEESTLATLKAYREVIDGLIAHHEGRVFGSAGDSVIAEFASPVEAVRCATEIQLEIDKRNADLARAEPHAISHRHQSRRCRRGWRQSHGRRRQCCRAPGGAVTSRAEYVSPKRSIRRFAIGSRSISSILASTR